MNVRGVVGPGATFGAVPSRELPARRSGWDTIKLSLFLGWQDIRLMYRRSVLGQFWITLSMAITFAAIGSVFGFIFNTPLAQYLPFLGCGLVFWSFMSVLLTEGATSFIAAESFLKQLPLPLTTFFLRTVWKTIFVMLHNVAALIVLLLIFPQGISAVTLSVVPGVLLATTAMGGIALALAVVSTRFRDVPQILGAVIQVCFYVTPIVWQPESIPEGPRGIILFWNPFYHLLQVIRQPLLNVAPSWTEWGIALGLAVVSAAIGWAVYLSNRTKIAFWV
ncbi:MAG: ABC transporter permease [Leifsonia xyli]|nr:MAG: ABC transporter permease [Leifsonia xyli]